MIVDKPGAPQTALFAYGLGLPITTPDLQTLQVMNYTLGASFGSRINMNLREEHGYTYGANSSYAFYRGGGPFVAGGLMRTNITADAVKELLYEIKRFPSNPPTDAELKMAKEARVQSLPGQFETTAATAGALRLDLPLRPPAQLLRNPAGEVHLRHRSRRRTRRERGRPPRSTRHRSRR